MAVLNVCNRTTPGKTLKFQMENVNITDTVGKLKKEIIKTIETEQNDIELIYCGQKLKDECNIELYNIKTGSTLYALPKIITEEPVIINPLSEQQVMVSLKAAIRKPAYPQIVQRILSDPKKVADIISNNPGLQTDPAVLSMLVDVSLLLSLLKPSNISKLMSRHPVFGPVTLAIATMVNEEAGKEGGAVASGGGSYSIDQMSDEEDEAGVGMRPMGLGSRPITASQLAAALMQAQGQTPEEAGPSTSSTDGTSPSITEQFFQQALLSAVPEEALQQIRDMGITDEARARQALVQTGGDINAALELLFESRS